MADLEQALAKLDEIGGKTISRSARIQTNDALAVIRAEVERLQRQLEEANERALDAAGEALGKSEGRAMRAEATVAQLRQALEGADTWIVDPEGATIHLPPEHAAKLDAALAGPVPATGTAGEEPK